MKKDDGSSWSKDSLLIFLIFGGIFGLLFLVKTVENWGIEKGPEYSATGRGLYVECVDNHKFVVYAGGFGGGVSQMLTLNDKGNLVPAMCTEKSTQ